MKSLEYIESLDFFPVIVLVDDNPKNIQTAIQHLRKIKNCNVVPFTNSESAIKYITKHPPHLILMDIMIETDEEGYETCRKLKEFPNKKVQDIPLIFLTAKSEDSDMVKGFQVGGVDYIRKPINQIIFISRIATHLELYIKTIKILDLAERDGLTGIYNRRSFDIFLKDAIKKCSDLQSCICIILADIDKFKQYNDNYGHLSGDEVLKKVASTFKSTLQRKSNVVARYGGEEFIAFIENDAEEAEFVCKQFKKNIETLAILHEHCSKGIVSLSLGVYYIIPDENTDPLAVIKKADLNLYKAKESGRDKFVISGYKEDPIQQ